MKGLTQPCQQLFSNRKVKKVSAGNSIFQTWANAAPQGQSRMKLRYSNLSWTHSFGPRRGRGLIQSAPTPIPWAFLGNTRRTDGWVVPKCCVDHWTDILCVAFRKKKWTRQISSMGYVIRHTVSDKFFDEIVFWATSLVGISWSGDIM